ncbi:hypothetical protein D5018_04285 [Parashewanella curva]|uniref:Uncharacterized protein n=1 Tax=Parashewanella curva TaxID=2338552 RepID=A0A3L8PZM7_9GAMM|nr:hypothetical protein [Parashewanella curva]RLV60867.1 hypothetical protein D5018_04285 [Parashewanella curva]
MGKRIVGLIFLFSFSVFADESALSVDRAISNNIELAFPNDSNIQPDLSDFEVINFVLLSNETGERWAVVTFKNLSSGRRTVNEKHVLALLANGSRVYPSEFTEAFRGKEVKSVTINFSDSKFPILSVYSRT